MMNYDRENDKTDSTPDDKSETEQKLLSFGDKYQKRVKIDLGDDGFDGISIAFDDRWPLIRFLSGEPLDLLPFLVHTMIHDRT